MTQFNPIPTETEIRAELEKLKQLKPRLPMCAESDEPIQEAISAEIITLDLRLSGWGIVQWYGSGDDYVYEAALYAQCWLEGRAVDGPPSVSREKILSG